MGPRRDKRDLPDFSDLMPRALKGRGEGRTRTANWTDVDGAIPRTPTGEFPDLSPSGGEPERIRRTADWTSPAGPSAPTIPRLQTADWTDVESATPTLPFVKDGLTSTADWTMEAATATAPFAPGEVPKASSWADLLD